MKPLTLAICVTILAGLVIGTCGCTSSSNTSTATPTITPTATSSSTSTTTTSGQDALLTAMINALNKTNQAPLGIDWVSSHIVTLIGSNYEALIYHFGSVANATNAYDIGVGNITTKTSQTESPNAWGLSSYTAAAGHAPTTQHVTTVSDGGSATRTAAQYDDVYILYATTSNSGGAS